LFGSLITILIASTAAASWFSERLPVQVVADYAFTNLRPYLVPFPATMWEWLIFAAGFEPVR